MPPVAERKLNDLAQRAGYDLVKDISDRSCEKEWFVEMEEAQVVIDELIKMGYLDYASCADPQGRDEALVPRNPSGLNCSSCAKFNRWFDPNGCLNVNPHYFCERHTKLNERD